MKKLFAIAAILFFASATVVFADYATSYQSYVNSTGSYQISFNDYLVAKAAYLASGSLESQSKAQSSTLKMLQNRDNLISNYLNAINAKIQSTDGITDGDKSTLQNEINNEIGWYNSHSTKLNSAGSLGDLVTDSNEAKTQFTNSTQLIIYQGIITLGIGNNSNFRNKLNEEISSLQSKIAEIKGNQDKDVSLIERSLIDVKNKIARSQDKDNTARDLVNSIKPNSSNNSSGSFQTAQTNVQDSNSYLKESNQDLLQIINQIKTN